MPYDSAVSIPNRSMVAMFSGEPRDSSFFRTSETVMLLELAIGIDRITRVSLKTRNGWESVSDSLFPVRDLLHHLFCLLDVFVVVGQRLTVADRAGVCLCLLTVVFASRQSGCERSFRR